MFNVQPKCCQTEQPDTYTLTHQLSSLSLKATVVLWLRPSLAASGLPHDCSYILSTVISALEHILQFREAVRPSLTSNGSFSITMMYFDVWKRHSYKCAFISLSDCVASASRVISLLIQ